MELNMLVNTIKNLVGKDFEVYTQMVTKGNTTLTGISIGNGTFKPTVYMEHFENMFREKGYEAVAREMIDICKNAEIPSISVSEMTSLDFVKDHLIVCVSPVGTNNEYVTIPYLDLELYFRVVIEQGDNIGTYKITEKMLNEWGLTKEELLDYDNNVYTCQSMSDVMKESMREEGYSEEEVEMMFGSDYEEIGQHVVGNKLKMYGASVIYKKEILKSIADKCESNLFILPSSIHELLIIPTDINEYVCKEDIDSMVKNVNETEVKLEEVLADHAYIFHRDTMEIEW